MARCGCSGAAVCNCLVEAGTGTTVTGSGTASNPYVISADSATLTDIDTPTVTLTLTGGPDYVLQADVNLSSDADNVLTSDATGLLLRCSDIAACFALLAGDGIDSTALSTGVVQVCLSTDVGNTAIFGADGCLFVPAATGTALTAGNGIDATALAANTVQACLSTDAGNIIVFGADGCLYVPTPAATTPTTVAELDTVTVNTTVTGGPAYIVSSDVIVSPDAGNTLVVHPNGLYVPTPAAATVVTVAPLDTATIDSVVTGGPAYIVSGNVKISATAGNKIVANADGIYSPGPCLSTDAGNIIVFGTDGCLYVPTPAAATPTTVAPLDTATFDSVVTGGPAYIVSGNVKISATAGNTLVANADGLFVPAAASSVTVAALDTNSINTTVTGGPAYIVSADVIPDPAATNLLSVSAAGVLAAVHVGPCGISGTGTAASPLVAITATAADWASKFACAQVAANGSGIYCDTATGQLIGTPPTTRIVSDQTLTSVAGSAEVNAIGVPVGGAPAVFGPTLSGTFTNTNTCRAMIVTVTGGVKHFNMRADTGGRLQFQYGLQLTLTGPAAGVYAPNGAHVQFMADGNRTGTDPNWDFIWDTVATTQIQQFVLPAGASFNYTLQGIAQLTNYNGDGQVNTLQVFAHFDGQTI